MGICAPKGNTALEIVQCHRTDFGKPVSYMDNINVLELLKKHTTEPSIVKMGVMPGKGETPEAADALPTPEASQAFKDFLAQAQKEAREKPRAPVAVS